MHTNLVILLLTCFLLTGCGGILYEPPTTADYCGIDPALLDAETEGNTVLKLWTNQERQFCWRGFAPFLAAKQQPNLGLDVRVRMFEMNSAPFTDYLMVLAERGEAPDIAFAHHDQVIRLGEAGHLYPLDRCRQHPGFASIPDKFWTGFSADGQLWGIPMDIEVMLLFYNKNLLHQLGWSQSQIDTFPKRIARGDYTLDDLVATARTAIDNGVVKSGLAFIPNRNQYRTIEGIYVHVGGRYTDQEQRQLIVNRQALEQAYSFLATLHRHQLFDTRMAMASFADWGNKVILKDASIHERVLFWHTYNTERQSLAMSYLNSPDDATTLDDHIGVALLPSSTIDQPGYSLLSSSGDYVIFDNQATGQANQQAACHLLAATQASGLLKRHTQKSGIPTFTEGGFTLPEWFPSDLRTETMIWSMSPVKNIYTYGDILKEVGVRVERGELTASDAVDVAVERLRDTLGSQLIVE
ncbi:MAG: extracellular solute-binding protein [Chloroflexota bacterium]